MENNLTRYQETLLHQVILQSIAESMRDAIKPQLRPLPGSSENSPLMEINVGIGSNKDIDKADGSQHNNNPKQDEMPVKSAMPNNGMPLNLEDDYFGTYSYNSDDTHVWDPLNIPESDTSSNSSSSTESCESLVQMEEERVWRSFSPELGVPHPVIFRNPTNSKSK
ncbi:hypothetical protein ACQ4LE_006826 [Meloidogyne hapla]|uniref:Ovule protein n=1 Tax=Meloidogyne hapla TaxID=6305 RepID=A0A1I8BC49_MELHA